VEKRSVDRDRAFGRLLRRLRKAHDLTQDALAQRAFCAVDTIKKIEAGLRRPSRQLAEQFADCLALAGDDRAAFLASARAVASDKTSATGEAATQRHARLPHQPVPLIGREAELSALSALFARPATRLVTLVGPGGMGKTRLAIALAEQLLAAHRFPDGVCFVPLAALDSAAQIAQALAEALGLALDAGAQPARPPQQQVLDYLRARRLLLVLDNVEHLLNGAEADDAAGLVAALLGSAPGLAILATSRERLKLREEQVFPLGGLDVPSAEAPSRDSAVALFVQRARQLRPDFEPSQLDAVVHICRLVDGMPLAIELAAGWAGALAPSEIAAAIERGLGLLATELRDVPARHRNMRAVFDASYRRLGAAEQAAFARLAIFRGGGTFQALQEVAQATPAQLQALIDASLLSYDAGRSRYTLHELLRQYAAEQLGAAPGEQERTRDQHAAYYSALAQQQGAELSGPGQQTALATLDAERENVRAAWAWAAQRGRIDLLAQAMDGLGYFYEWRGALDDGERAYQSAAAQLEAQPADDEDVRVLAMLRAWQSNFSRLLGDITEAEQLLRQSLALLDRAPAGLDTRAERAFALLQLGQVASEGPLDDARRCLEQSLALYQALGRRWETSHVLLWLGDLARYEGAYEEARQHFRASMAIRTVCGDRRGLAELLNRDSHVAAEIGQVEEAEALARQNYVFLDELGDPANRATGLGELGVVLMWAGKYEESHRLLQQSLELHQDLGNRAMSMYTLGWLAVACLGIGRYGEAHILSQQATAQAREVGGSQSGLAFLLHYAGWGALTLGAYRDAEAMLQESVALHRQTGNTGRLGWPLAQLGYVYWRLGDRLRAQAVLCEVLQTAVRQHDYLSVLLAIPAIALMLAEQGHQERAVELYALSWQHPVIAGAQSFTITFGRPLDAVAAALPPGIAAAAQARGQALDLWGTAAALEGELAALGWGKEESTSRD
jgi:predicted ATPase/transcriptional regulator with XRE-family HTH domain